MDFAIGPDVLERFPGVRLALVVVRGASNPASPPEVVAALREAERRLRDTGLDAAALQDDPRVREWREAYVAFGANPNKFRNSVEALARRVLSGKELPSISTLVDLYNTVSLAYLVPAGGDDTGKVEGGITLAIAQGTERFVPIGDGAQPETASAGEVIYRDESDVLCRRWNWRESGKTCMTHETRDACLVLETLGALSSEALREAADALADGIRTRCGASVGVRILDREHPSVALEQVLG